MPSETYIIQFPFGKINKIIFSYFYTYHLVRKEKLKGRAFGNILCANSVLWLVQIQWMWQITGFWLAKVKVTGRWERNCEMKMQNLKTLFCKTPKHIVSKEPIMDGIVRQLIIIIILYNLQWIMKKHRIFNVPSPPFLPDNSKICIFIFLQPIIQKYIFLNL